MGESVYRQAMERTVQDLVQSKSEWAALLAEYTSKLNSGFFESQYRDALGQRFMKYDLSDAYAFSFLHSCIQFGYIMTALVGLPSGPSSDKDIEGNNEILGKIIAPSLFHAEFWGGLADCDGEFEVKSEITLGQILPKTGKEKTLLYGPGTLPLEVGYTSPIRTYFHIIESGGLARWPYQDNRIWVFVADPDWLSDFKSGAQIKFDKPKWTPKADGLQMSLL